MVQELGFRRNRALVRADSTADRLRVSWLAQRIFIRHIHTARAEDAQGTSTQSHISPSVLVHEDYQRLQHPVLLYHGPF